MKKKILLLSDDLRMTSGVSTMSKEIVLGTVHKYDWVQLGAGINHPDKGKIIDVSEDVKKITNVNDANVKVIPYNGYGDISIIRKLLKEETPDAILHFTDPHYWQWLYDNEHEIRQQVPLLYWHVWDNVPDPKFNQPYYGSCDWVGCISKLTYGVVNRVVKLNNSSNIPKINYVPHGINSNVFKPLKEISINVKNSINPDGKYSFILFYNNRNIRRKQPSDVIHSFKLFCDMLSKEDASKCLLLMHTVGVDQNGTDLPSTIDAICPDYDVVITDKKFDQKVLNELYNIADCTINIANNEGFGLTTAESLMAGTPIIVNVTGGLQDQCGFNLIEDDYIEIKSLNDKIKDHYFMNKLTWGEWALPVWPSTISLSGSVPTPYLFDDRVNVNDVATQIYMMYMTNKKRRKKIGLLGRKFMMKNFSSEFMCNKLIEGIDETINDFKPRRRFELIRIV